MGKQMQTIIIHLGLLLLAVTCYGQEQPCRDPTKEELQTINEESPLIALNCSEGLTSEIQKGLDNALSRDELALREVQELQEAARDEILQPMSPYTGTCPIKRYWLRYARLYNIKGGYRYCFSLTPIQVTACASRSCSFPNMVYLSTCVNHYCYERLRVGCVTYSNGVVLYTLHHWFVWVPCCCNCHYRLFR